MTDMANSESENDQGQRMELLKRQLAEAQKMAALGELVGTTTHEFNNLLMTILNYAKIGLRHNDDKTRTKAFNKILLASERATKITNNILGMARNRSLEPEPTDLKLLISDSLVLLEREMNKYRIRVDLQLADVPEAMVVGNQIQQVLLNLLINARQAMPNGGEVLIQLSHNQPTNTVDLKIRDNGCGIEQEELRKIFDPYFSTKSGPDETGKGGTGLGLSACREIIQRHQGKIRVESSVGKGTAFTIMLPAYRPTSVRSAAVTAPVASTANQTAVH